MALRAGEAEQWQRITPFLWFEDHLDEAIEFYGDLLKRPG
jgi:predicted 3-demethylubiquinone-9 3-methyltransferase (glyoxalase superfamily)